MVNLKSQKSMCPTPIGGLDTFDMDKKNQKIDFLVFDFLDIAHQHAR